MTKTQYRNYIASEAWQNRRRTFLLEYDECRECGIPRWLAVMVYDQDLNVDHLNYQRVGCELDSDLQSLCKRCHEVKHFGRSELHRPVKPGCDHCKAANWCVFGGLCEECFEVDIWQRYCTAGWRGMLLAIV